MNAPTISDEQFIQRFSDIGPQALSEEIGVNLRNINARRRRIEQRHGIAISTPNQHWALVNHPAKIDFEIKDGVVLIGSDAHYWPGRVTTAHKAFIKFIKELKPKLVCMNGDVLDGATISRHAPIGWESRPTLIQEIEEVQARLGEIEQAAGKRCALHWQLGNHDARFESKLANVAPEYAKIHGIHLKDHFPLWESCWATFINNDVVVKHRQKSGIHAPHNNTMWAGRTIITGHLHSLKVMPVSDYNGDRWGVDCGTLAEPYGPQFSNYTELGAVNWRSGFVVLTFHKGRLLWPEVVRVLGKGKMDFRGAAIVV